MALAVYDGMVTFDNIGMEAYDVSLTNKVESK